MHTSCRLCFIRPTHGGEFIFVHYTKIYDPYVKDLSIGTWVEYEEAFDDRKGKPNATNATVIRKRGRPGNLDASLHKIRKPPRNLNVIHNDWHRDRSRSHDRR